MSQYSARISDENPESKIKAGDINVEYHFIRGVSDKVEVRSNVNENGDA